MNKLLNNKWVATALACMALSSVFYSVRSSLFRGVRPASPAAAGVAPVNETQTPAYVPPVPKAADADAPVTIRRELARGRTQRWLESPERDPFAVIARAAVMDPNKASSKYFAPVTVSAIWRQAGRQFAVINGRVVGEGDRTVEDFTVDRIEREAVVLRRADVGTRRADFPAFNQFTNKAALPAQGVPLAKPELDLRLAAQPGG